MGRQINFYMLPEDERRFARALRATSDVQFVSERSDANAIAILDDFPEQGTEKSRTGIILCNSELPIPELRNYGQWYFVNKEDSEVIEFRQSEPRPEGLRPGRIWAEMYVYDANGNRYPKSECFKKWYETIARWIRKNFEKGPNGRYVGPAAKEWASKGGVLA